MKHVKEGVIKAVIKAAEKEVRGNGDGWPPQCIGFIYQPKRPEKKNKERR